ncbi:lipoprotein [Rugosimonospora africana]|uniref:Lipoprotein n=1 Tax=Rugosimonospora africana TaxID=556532 RepID=A0A8J3R1Q9_9ACTN|nr:phosphatidylinositol-specific phospholipase C domain-containing protein [Rugosimonospora africana]GIH18591.1 lipoprotein [Rugosimonospora africana]
MRRSRFLVAAAVAAASAFVVASALVVAAASPASAAGSGSRFSETTTVGTHNTYDPATFQYLAQALDQHPGLIELDVWDDIFTREWKVSHDNPLGNGNNCVAASSASQLYTGGANKDLEYCLDDIRVWLAAHPGTGPLFLKLELKAGFSSRTGLGPAQLDSAIAAHLGSAVFKPADLASGYASLDAAAKANAWPTRAQLAGKVVIEIIPGTVEENNPTDSLWTDVEYAQYLKGLAASGTLSKAQIFPAVHNAASGDPRTRYGDATLRPWFVVFDGDATQYVTGGIDTSWYDTNHYLLVMTDAQNVPPAVADGDAAAAQARVAALAAAHASVASSDWSDMPQVVGLVDTRG